MKHSHMHYRSFADKRWIMKSAPSYYQYEKGEPPEALALIDGTHLPAALPLTMREKARLATVNRKRVQGRFAK